MLVSCGSRFRESIPDILPLACHPVARTPMRRLLSLSVTSLAIALPSVATAQLPENCLETTFAGGNGGGVDWVVMFDLEATESMTISGLRTNMDAPVGDAVEIEIYTAPTSFGNETDPTAWTSAGSSTASSAGAGNPTEFLFGTPIEIPLGTSGFAVHYIAGEADYTNGNGANEVHSTPDGALTFTANGSVGGLFTGGTFQPRVWNGNLCYDLGSAEKVTTLFNNDNGGAEDGAVYFDVEATRPTTIGSLLVHTETAAGTAIGLEIYTTDDTFSGNETTPGVWVLAATDDGTAISNGEGVPTPVTLENTFQIPPGTTGIAIVADGFEHEYTNGTGSNQSHLSGDGNLRIVAGSATNVPFTGGVFSPRVFNGQLCSVTEDHCVETLFESNNGGAVGGAVYFDVVSTEAVAVSGLTANLGETGAVIGIEMWTRNGTFAGNEGSPAGWNLAATGDGIAIGAGDDLQTAINFTGPANLPAGRTGVALVLLGGGHEYTNGTGANQVHTSQDGILTIEAGSATNVPFTGTPFSPRVWNGTLCYDAPFIGNEFCEAVPNSSGQTGTISATGSNDASDNNVRLIARNLPVGQFGIFVTSQGFGVIPNAGGSIGTLCIADPLIGRYQSQIQNSGGDGAFSLLIDLTNHPTSLGSVTVTAGQDWNFQAWHRDIFGGMAASNYTNALRIQFE